LILSYQEGDTAFMYACFVGSLKLMRVLLKAGADRNTVTEVCTTKRPSWETFLLLYPIWIPYW